MMAQAYFVFQKNLTIMMAESVLVHLQILLGHSSIRYQDLL